MPLAPTATIVSESPNLFREQWEETTPSTPVSEAGKRVTLQEYWDTYYLHEHFAYEWNNGILEEKPMTDYDSLKLYQWFRALLAEYLRSHPIADVTELELGVKLKNSVRKPDTGIVIQNNATPFQSGDHTYHGVCDLCIELLSISNSTEIKRDTVIKKREYAQNGVTEYFILDHRHKETAFYRLNPNTNRYNKIPAKQKEIIESEVLPGFRFRLSDLKKQTPLESLVNDPIYSYYVLLGQQAEQKKREEANRRAEEATFLAEQERKEKEEANRRADQERQKKEEANRRADQAMLKAKQAEEKTEKLINLLKSQGLNPDDLL